MGVSKPKKTTNQHKISKNKSSKSSKRKSISNNNNKNKSSKSSNNKSSNNKSSKPKSSKSSNKSSKNKSNNLDTKILKLGKKLKKQIDIKINISGFDSTEIKLFLKNNDLEIDKKKITKIDNDVIELIFDELFKNNQTGGAGQDPKLSEKYNQLVARTKQKARAARQTQMFGFSQPGNLTYEHAKQVVQQAQAAQEAHQAQAANQAAQHQPFLGAENYGMNDLSPSRRALYEDPELVNTFNPLQARAQPPMNETSPSGLHPVYDQPHLKAPWNTKARMKAEAQRPGYALPGRKHPNHNYTVEPFTPVRNAETPNFAEAPQGGFAGIFDQKLASNYEVKIPIYLTFDVNSTIGNPGVAKTPRQARKVRYAQERIHLSDRNTTNLQGLELIFLTAHRAETYHMKDEVAMFKAMAEYKVPNLVPAVSAVHIFKEQACFLIKRCIPLDHIDLTAHKPAIDQRIDQLVDLGYGHFDIKPSNMCWNDGVFSFLDLDAQYFYPIAPEFYKTTKRIMKLQFWGIYNKSTQPKIITPRMIPAERLEFCTDLVRMGRDKLREYIKQPSKHPIEEKIKVRLRHRHIQTPLHLLVHYLAHADIAEQHEIGWVTQFIDRVEKGV